MSLGKKRDIIDSMWSVFTSFGFYESEKDEGEKYCLFNNENAVCVNNCKGVKSRAETAAVCIEAALANGLDNFSVILGDRDVFELLTLFGFEKIIKLGEIENGFSAQCGEIEFARGTFEKDSARVEVLINSFMEALESEGVDMSDDVAASLIFAEKNAEGIAYYIAYSLRVNGCIVEYFNEEADIKAAEEYAEKRKMSCILRAYPDGRLLMKDLIKNEITETTAQEFLGYYDEEEEDCDCGCGEHHHHHHHGEDCDCGCH